MFQLRLSFRRFVLTVSTVGLILPATHASVKFTGCAGCSQVS